MAKKRGKKAVVETTDVVEPKVEPKAESKPAQKAAKAAQVTNNYTANLVLHDGTILPAGKTVVVEGFDKLKGNPMCKAWIDAKLIEVK